MDHDDELAPHALAVVVLYMAQNPQWRLIYSDEDKITATGERYYPSFKRDFDPLLLLGQNYINHFSVVSTELLTAVGGLRSEFDGAQDWDMWLRLTEKVGRAEIGHIPHVLYHWRAGEGSAALSSDGKPMAATAGERAVKEAISRGGYTATVGTTEHPGHLLVNFVPKSTPLVDIVIPTRDGAMLGRCLESLICTTYPNYRVTVIDNGSIKTSTKRTLAKYPGVGVVRDPSPFNYSAMHNRVVPALSGEFLVMLNDDTEVIEPSWLTTMVGLATGYGAGIVGAKLLYPDNTIQHAGVVITPSGARHILSREPSSTGGYRGQAICAQEFSAVTGACLMVRRELYLGLGGMNEELVVAFNDVDLCLRARERGEIVAWHPGVLLYHHESLSRGKEHTPDSFVRGHKESEILKSRHLGIFQRDPYYNTNLTDSDPTYELCWPPRLSPWVLST
jgi:GT2 family glycosyltransferase